MQIDIVLQGAQQVFRNAAHYRNQDSAKEADYMDMHYCFKKVCSSMGESCTNENKRID